jgi:hypothetical protein
LFYELAETLLYGLRELGYEASMATNRLSETSTNIVLGAGLITEAMTRIIPRGSIFYNTERVGSEQDPWISAVLAELAFNCEIWDISRRNVDALNLLGISASFVPIGYVPQLSRIRNEDDKDIDVLFHGYLNERRLHILEELCGTGLRICALSNCFGYFRDSLVSRSKVELNMHFCYPPNILEIMRVSYLLANKKAVVAEINEDTEMEPCLREGVAGAGYDQLAKTCQALVDDVKKRSALEQRGFEIMSSLREEEYLGPIMERRKR